MKDRGESRSRWFLHLLSSENVITAYFAPKMENKKARCITLGLQCYRSSVTSTTARNNLRICLPPQRVCVCVRACGHHCGLNLWESQDFREACLLALIHLWKWIHLMRHSPWFSSECERWQTNSWSGRADQKSFLPFGCPCTFTSWHIRNSSISHPSSCPSPELHQSYASANNNRAQPGGLNDFCMLHSGIWHLANMN